MGLYDTVVFKCELPEEVRGVQEWQTKDFDSYMNEYVVTADGKLVVYLTEYCPEEERPYWGKPEWETKPHCQLIGLLRKAKEPKLVDYHGVINVIGVELPTKFIEMDVTFTHGQLESIKVLR